MLSNKWANSQRRLGNVRLLRAIVIVALPQLTLQATAHGNAHHHLKAYLLTRAPLVVDKPGKHHSQRWWSVDHEIMLAMACKPAQAVTNQYLQVGLSLS